MAKIPANAKKIENKTIPFIKKNEKFSHVKLLPEVLQTDANRQIISTTLDNITSRGSLEQINGFVGKKQGGYYSPAQDRYLPDNAERAKYQLSPSPVSYDEDEIYSVITIDDLKNSLKNLDASTNNWNTQLDIESYTFSPPFDIDKFINFNSYFWIDDIIYIKINTVDISAIVGKTSATIGNIQLKNGLSFKFTTNTGSTSIVNLRNDEFQSNIIYTVTGVGEYIEFIPFTIDDKQSLFTSDIEESIFPAQFVCIKIGAPNRNAWSRTNFWIHQHVIEVFKNELLYDSNATYNVGDWVYQNNLFYKKITQSGNADLTNITEWVSKYDLITDYKNIQAQRPIIEFNNRLEMHNTGTNFLTLVDHWSLYKSPADIISSGTIDKQWKLANGTYSTVQTNHALNDGDIIILSGTNGLYRNKVYRFNIGTPNTLTEIPVEIGDVVLFSNQYNTYNNIKYIQEYWWDGINWQNTQLKETSNQAPLFNLYNYQGSSITSFNNNNFAGNTIFEYSKQNSGNIDPYLGFPIVYLETSGLDFDINSTSYIQFRYTQQDRYTFLSNNENQTISGFYFTKLLQNNFYNTEFSNSWKFTYVPQQTTKTITKVYDSNNFAKDFVIPLPTNKIGYGNQIQVSLNQDVYFTYKRDGKSSLPIQGKNPDLYIPTNKNTEIYVSIDPYTYNYVYPDYVDDAYVENLTFKILDEDGNLVVNGVTNNNIDQGTISVDILNEQILTWKLGDKTGKIYIVDEYKMPGSIKIFKNNLLQYPGSQVEVANKVKDYYYLDSNTIIFPYFDTDETTYSLNSDGSINFISSSTQNIPLKGLKINDVFNISYVTYDDNDKTLFDTPTILQHNWKNQEVDNITYNQIFNHFFNKISDNPLLDGPGLGVNNYYNIKNTENISGSIFQYTANGADALINFANNDLDIINSIRFSKNQFRNYKNNFVKTLAGSLQKTNSTDVYEIVNSVLEKINLGKNIDNNFFNSSMIYYNGFSVKEIEILLNQTLLDMENTVANVDEQGENGWNANNNQHVYLYIYEDDGTGTFIYTQLIKDIDYVLSDSLGNYTESPDHIKLTTTYNAGTKFRIVITSQDSFSYCAPTPAKFGITPAYVPGYESISGNIEEAGIDYYFINEISNNFGYTNNNNKYNINTSSNELLRCHDGSLIIVNALLPRIFYNCILEFEKRIYNNIYTKRQTWDNETDPENYYFKNQNFTSTNFQKHFNKFLFNQGISNLVNSDFNISDPFTWNYSKLGVPGNFRGLYRYYVGSATPNRTPWECLGHGSKPSWWDDNYTWLSTANGGDDQKRLSLINALIYGYSEDPSLGVGQREDLIRTDISNAIQNLVNEDGTLNNPVDAQFFSPAQIDLLSEKDIRKPWKYNDLSVIEQAYKNSSDFVFDYVEASYSTFPILFFRKYWKSHNLLQILDNQRVFINNKLRAYTPQQKIHSPFLYHFSVLGLNQYCLEYLKFKKIDTEFVNKILLNLDTIPLVKLGGFSKKSLLKFKFDTLLNQNKSNFIPEEDYKIYLNKSNSVRDFFVSTIKITKVSRGYQISGYNPLEKSFKIQRVTPSTDTLSVKVTNDIFIQEPKRFDNDFIEVNYNVVLNGIQEVYNFIIQYGKYLETQGILFDELKNILSWRTLGIQFVIWAKDFTRQLEDVFYIQQNPNNILLYIEHGFIDFKNQRLVENPLIINEFSKSIPNSKITIAREDNQTLISCKEAIFGIQLYVKTIEHIVLLNNTTKFNDIISNNLLGISKPRVKIIGKKTQDWKGKPKADGFIVKKDTIIENLESSASNFSQYNAIESSIASSQLQKTSRYNIGYTKPEYLQNLDIDDDLSYEFYTGTIHEKGTDAVFNKLLRNKDLFLKDSNFQINTKDEWLFRLGEFGDVEGQQTLEFEMPKSLVKTNPQTVTFLKQYDLARDSDYDDRITLFSNDKKWVWKPTYSPLQKHILNLNILERTLQNDEILPKLVLDNNLTKSFYTLLKGHTYILKPMEELASYFTNNSVKFLIATITGSGESSTLTNYTENVSYEGQNLIFKVPNIAPQRLYITISDKLAQPLFGFSLLVLPNDYEFNESIFKTRDYLDFKYNNIYYTQYKEDLPNAGYPMVGDALFEIRNLEQLPDIDLSDSSLFGIPNWDPSLRYREGDLVRWKGVLYKAQRTIPAQAEFTTTVAGGVQSGDAITLTKYNKTIPLIGSTMMFSGIDQKYTFMELIEDTTDTYTAILFPTVTQELSDLQNVVVTAPTPQRFDWLGDGDEEAIYYDDEYWLAQLEDSIFSVWLSDYDRFGFNVLQLMDYEDSTSYQVTDKITDIIAHEGVDTDPPKTRSYIQEICAGNEAGDLAMVKFAVDHTLKVGDYVLINGAVNNNNLNAIHRVYGFPEGVDDTGKSFADSMILIEQFIEENEYDCKLFVFKPTRFKTLEDLQNTSNDNSYYWRDGNLAYVDKGVSGNWEVYKYNRLTGMQLWLLYGNDDYYGALKNGYGFNAFPDGTVNQLIKRTHPQQVDSRAIDNVVIYNKIKNEILLELEVFDPFKGIIPGIADKELDFKSWYDPADYNETNDPDINLNTKTSWNNEFLGKTWWNLNTVRYYNYEQGPSEYRRKYWGKQFSVSSIDVYEWTKSPYHPSEYLAHIGETFEKHKLTGTPFSVTNNNDVYYYYSSNIEFDNVSRTYKEFYYFWVKNKTTVPNLPTRNISVAEITAIIDNPTSRGIRWCAPVNDNEIILANIKDIVNENSVVQVNLNLTDNYQHSEWFTLRENDNTSVVPELFKLKMKQSMFGYREITNIMEHYRLKDNNINLQINDIYPDDISLTYKLVVDENGATQNFNFEPGQLVKYNGNYYRSLKSFGLVNNPLTPGQIVEIEGLLLPTSPEPYIPWTLTPNYDYDNNGINESYAVQLDEHEIYLLNVWDPIYNVVELQDSIINKQDFAGYTGQSESSLPNSNLIGLIDKQEIPEKFANTLAKYGNKIFPNQSWIKNKIDARRVFVLKFNQLIKSINIVDDLSYWNTENNPVFKNTAFTNGSFTYDITQYWIYTEWFSDSYISKTTTDTVLLVDDLLSVDLGPNKVVKVLNDGLDDIAIYESIKVANEYQWKKTYKEKGTIKLLDTLWDTRSENGFDIDVFDSTTFDSGPEFTFEVIYKEIEEKIFTGLYESKYTSLWFELIKYILKEQFNVDWIIKSSFIQLKFVSNGNITSAFYNDNDEQVLVDYINAYKPYHTKIRKVFNTKVFYELANVTAEETELVISVTTP